MTARLRTSSRGHDEQRVAVWITQAELRRKAGERRAAPPHDGAFGKRLSVAVDACGLKRRKVAREVVAQEDNPGFNASRPFRPREDEAQVRAAVGRLDFQPTLPVSYVKSLTAVQPKT